MTSSVADLLREARALGVDRLDAQLLLARHLGRTRAWLIAHDDHGVPDSAALACRRDFSERTRGVPVAYLLGEREFHGLMLRVTRDVLVPRPDTELLVDWSLELLTGPLAARDTPELVDLGTGSGAIALAIKHRCPRARVLAVDASAAALEVARDNSRELGLAIEIRHGDWLEGLRPQRFDLIVSNPPYIDGDDPHLAALHAEPVDALTPGIDGVTCLREIVSQAPACLHDGGWLLLEHGHTQSDDVARLMLAAGFSQIATRRDVAGRPRCTGGQWRAEVTSASG